MELVDTHALGACAVRHEGSSPSIRTTLVFLAVLKKTSFGSFFTLGKKLVVCYFFLVKDRKNVLTENKLDAFFVSAMCGDCVEFVFWEFLSFKTFLELFLYKEVSSGKSVRAVVLIVSISFIKRTGSLAE